MRHAIQVILTLALIATSITAIAAKKDETVTTANKSTTVYDHRQAALNPGVHAQQLDDAINMQGLTDSKTAAMNGDDIILSS